VDAGRQSPAPKGAPVIGAGWEARGPDQ
jgi:hypothetical protein